MPAPTAYPAGPIVVDCPECRRTIWANTVCTHGTVPPPSKDAPKEDAVKEAPRYRLKTRDKHRPGGDQVGGPAVD